MGHRRETDLMHAERASMKDGGFNTLRHQTIDNGSSDDCVEIGPMDGSSLPRPKQKRTRKRKIIRIKTTGKSNLKSVNKSANFAPASLTARNGPRVSTAAAMNFRPRVFDANHPREIFGTFPMRGPLAPMSQTLIPSERNNDVESPKIKRFGLNSQQTSPSRRASPKKATTVDPVDLGQIINPPPAHVKPSLRYAFSLKTQEKLGV